MLLGFAYLFNVKPPDAYCDLRPEHGETRSSGFVVCSECYPGYENHRLQYYL